MIRFVIIIVTTTIVVVVMRMVLMRGIVGLSLGWWWWCLVMMRIIASIGGCQCHGITGDNLSGRVSSEKGRLQFWICSVSGLIRILVVVMRRRMVIVVIHRWTRTHRFDSIIVVKINYLEVVVG